MKYLLPTTALLLSFAAPVSALAYIGPGAGLSAIGAALALIGAILLGIVGFLWYPIKRLMKRRKSAQKADDRSEAEDAEETEDQLALSAERTRDEAAKSD